MELTVLVKGSEHTGMSPLCTKGVCEVVSIKVDSMPPSRQVGVAITQRKPVGADS
jgi:hypothetical protein